MEIKMATIEIERYFSEEVGREARIEKINYWILCSVPG